MEEEFQPITFNTLEEYEDAFKKRVERERKKYDGYVSPDAVEKMKEEYEKQINEFKTQITAQDEKYQDYDKTLKEKDELISKYESDSAKTKLAIQYGIPLELVSKISGNNSKELEEDAKQLAKYLGDSHKTSPEYKSSEADSDGVTQRFRELNPNLKL